MTKYLTNNLSIVNLYKNPYKNSEIVTQMIHGESFSILKKTKKWLKVKILEDGYKGYIQNKETPQKKTFIYGKYIVHKMGRPARMAHGIP